ncbi:LapA family protein [Fructilactobacillus hinvesii]|uniref:LapA family protein n=1 Tax=Fructilactobacillus hinvesii TaxID=2940300 RepID=A0ABY5BQB5_9LACO|nr:LapA family protein [Fructilactobacillus hinvesii]USS87309.1 LapA family protein [Fructilactobacillus hinvesii]
MKKQIGVITALILVIIVAIFVLMNMTSTEINFGFATVEFPLILIILGSMFVGAVLMFLFSSFSTFKNRQASKAATKEINDLNQQIASLKQQLLDQDQERLANQKAAEVEQTKQPDSDQQ